MMRFRAMALGSGEHFSSGAPSAVATSGVRGGTMTIDGIINRRYVSFTTSSSRAARGGDDERLSRFDASSDIKPDLVKRYLSETNASRAEANKRVLANERAAFARNEHDTGSSEVQIANLTQRIKFMTEHLRVHTKDAHSRHGLMAMLERRKKLLKYLRRTDGDKYADTILRLGLKDRSFVDDKYAK
jgi:ribosomal protein S15